MMIAVERNSVKFGIKDMVKQAVDILEKGGIILHATDTVWGLACSSKRVDAIKRMNQIKRRPLDKPCILLLDSFRLIRRYNSFVTPVFVQGLKAMTTPTTVIYPRWGEGDTSLYASQGGSVAVRVVTEPFCKMLIKELGSPIASTSANYAGEIPAASLSEVKQRIRQSVDWVVPYREKEVSTNTPSVMYKLGIDGNMSRVR